MSGVKKQNFDTFMGQLTETNVTLDLFSDFDKITKNAARAAIGLHTLDYLIGQEDLLKAVREIWDTSPSAFDVLGLLIAVRDLNKVKFNRGNQKASTLKSLCSTPEGIVEFLEGTGFANILRKSQISNLNDYVFGVETGLDSNARKNRGGKKAEKELASIFQKAGIPCREQVASKTYPAIARALEKDNKRFDFVIQTPLRTYLIEVNFYSGGGSKLNETARSYSEIAPKINDIQGFEFVWITDGYGWHKAKSKLEQAYKTIPSVYNFTTLPEFIRKIQAELKIIS